MWSWWLLILGANVGGVTAATSMTGAHAHLALRRLAYVYLTLIAVSGCLTVASASRVWTAPVPAGLDPVKVDLIRSQALIESLNCLWTGLLAFLVPAALALVLARRTRRDLDDRRVKQGE